MPKLGVGLIRLSMWLTKRIAFRALRLGLHTAVFTFWFMPGFAASEGGAMPGPLWLIILNERHKDQLDMPNIAKMFLAWWGVTWILTLCVSAFAAGGEKKDAAGGSEAACHESQVTRWGQGFPPPM